MSSVGRIHIGRQAKSLDIAPQFDGYSKVILNVTDELYYESGTSTGRTLTLFCPWGTQAMCNNILASIKGYQYQPLDAQGAILDPAAELGDGVSVKDSYSIIASLGTTFGPQLRANVSAPGEEEIDHEYPYKSQQERKVTRQFANVEAKFVVQANQILAEVNERKADTSQLRASLNITSAAIEAEVTARKEDIETVNAQFAIQAGQINAKVSKTGGSASSFGWEMTDSYMIWKANNSEIFRLDKNGAKVTGEINATTGKIGGLVIKNNSLTYNNQTWGGTNSIGIYLGPSGLQLGNGFKVDNNGNLDAQNGKFRGYVNAGMIRSDDVDGTGGSFNGAGITSHSLSGSRLKYNTVGTSYTSSGINASLGYADYAYDVVTGIQLAKTISARNLYTTNLTAADFEFDGHGVRWKTISYKNASNETVSVTVLARS